MGQAFALTLGEGFEAFMIVALSLAYLGGGLVRPGNLIRDTPIFRHKAVDRDGQRVRNQAVKT